MNITCIAFSVVLFIFGVLFLFTKLYRFFPFWKKMPLQERAKMNMKAISINIGLMIIVCSLILLAAGVWEFFYDKIFIWAMIIWGVAIVMDAVLISTKKLYYHDDSKKGQVNAKQK
ncbi:MAG: DUF3784 domain-containing protein [Coprobacillus sp.]|nr:DUF3784 domain-containing protein [Coprobacillus sp.]